MSSHKMSLNGIKIASLARHAPPDLGLNGSVPREKADENVLSIIKDRKHNKLFSKQDKLALKSAHMAWKESGIEQIDPDFSQNTGIYFCVGTLPFEDAPLNRLAQNSQENSALSMEKFSTDGFNSINPMLTFKCLPNMPLFHISYNLGITGRYFMTYPGVLDFFTALERAVWDLEHGFVKHALVGASCDQENFLTAHHLRRVQPEAQAKAIDCSAALVLTKSGNAPTKALLKDFDFDYCPHDPFKEQIILEKQSSLPAFCGPCSPLISLSLLLEEKSSGELKYKWEGNQGCRAQIELEAVK